MPNHRDFRHPMVVKVTIMVKVIIRRKVEGGRSGDGPASLPSGWPALPQHLRLHGLSHRTL
jgi:hypothetical protein